MASVNKVILLGNLGADPETRYMPNGDCVCNVRLATTESWKDRNSGEKRESTEWHRLVFFRKLGEIADQYLKKGSSIYVEGRIRTRKWQDKDGQERYTTEIEVLEFQMLGSPNRGGNGDGGKPAAPSKSSSESQGGGNRKGPSFDSGDDDIPY